MLQSIEFTELTAENAVETVINAFVGALGWIPDADGERVWINENKSLGLKVALQNTNLTLTAVNKQNNSSSPQSISISAPIALDYEKSKNKTAVLVGMRAVTAIPLSSVTHIFAKKSDGVYSSIFTTASSSGSIELCEGASASKSFVITTVNSESVSPFTSIYKLPSLFGGTFSEVYGVYSCPTAASYVRVAIDGRVFQATSRNGSRFAVEVSE